MNARTDGRKNDTIDSGQNNPNWSSAVLVLVLVLAFVLIQNKKMNASGERENMCARTTQLTVSRIIQIGPALH